MGRSEHSSPDPPPDQRLKLSARVSAILRRHLGDQLTSAPESRRSEPKRIVGLATRTTNATESIPSAGKIPQLWGRFSTEQWSERLEKVGAFGPTLAVYSAYESDASGSYQLLVGRQVRHSQSVSPPLQIVSAPQASYLVFRCSGPLPRAVIDGWHDVWAYFARADAPARAYTCDFETYPHAAPVEIWVAVRDR